jgi:glyoxylase-like metal-dependent hydrolase (beta-lactamase superfamily II)
MPDAIEYFHLTAPHPGETIEVRPGIHWLRMPLPFQLDHINLWLLEDGDGWTIVDTGLYSEVTIALWREILASSLKEKPVNRVLVTHFHPDHVGMAGWLCETLNVRLWMTQKEWLWARSWSLDKGPAVYDEQAAFLRTTGCPDTLLAATRHDSPRYPSLVSPIPRVFTRLRDGESIEIDGRNWEIIIGTGHAPEHACLYCAELGLMISGDQVLPIITPIVAVEINEPDANPLQDFLATIEKLRMLPTEIDILPSHNSPFSGLHGRLDALNRHHDDRLGQFLEACTRSMTAMELSNAIFTRPMDSQNITFALGETVAHLNYLCGHGSILRTERNDGVFLYSRT